MSSEEVKAKLLICDGCLKSQLVLVDDNPVEGFYIPTVSQVHPAGGWVAEGVYACSVRCIKPAVVKALERQNSNAIA